MYNRENVLQHREFGFQGGIKEIENGKPKEKNRDRQRKNFVGKVVDLL